MSAGWIKLEILDCDCARNREASATFSPVVSSFPLSEASGEHKVAYIQRTSSGTMKVDRIKELSKAATCCVADKNHNTDFRAANSGNGVWAFDI